MDDPLYYLSALAAGGLFAACMVSGGLLAGLPGFMVGAVIGLAFMWLFKVGVVNKAYPSQSKAWWW